MRTLFFLSLFLIFSSLIGYPVFLVLHKLLNKRKIELSEEKSFIEGNLPYISFIIAAYNEEKNIKEKLNNTLSLNYPKDKLEIIVASDCSSDNTDSIVQEFSRIEPRIKLLRIEKRRGKVNAQNEAVAIASGELLAFSDANNFWERDSIINLMKCAQSDEVACVCGKLVYVNELETRTTFSESLYWKIENKLKELESLFYSLTALNGGIYLVKRSHYFVADSYYSHDLFFPLLFGKRRKKTVYCKNAVAFEKSGANLADEKMRKVRMFSGVYKFLFKNPGFFLNPFSYNLRFFISVFCHRTIRYLLPFLHIFVFISNCFLLKRGLFFDIVFVLQIAFIFLSLLGSILGSRNKILFFMFYYLFFLATMLVGFWKYLRGEVKPYWEIAGSAR